MGSRTGEGREVIKAQAGFCQRLYWANSKEAGDNLSTHSAEGTHRMDGKTQAEKSVVFHRF